MEGKNSEKSKVDVILKVLLTLDYMKLCVDHEEPNGEGAPVDIVVMPDFVVDVDGADIEYLNKRIKTDLAGMQSAAKVGSRAGRVLSILAHLRDMDDEAFQLHYIAETGQPGRSILEDRLYKHLLGKNIQPLCFPLLIPCNLTRYAILGRSKPNEFVPDRNVLKSRKGNLLKVQELERHFYSPIEKIHNARALYFATDSFQQFEELIDIAILGEKIEKAKERTRKEGKRQKEKREKKSEALQKDIPGERHVFIDFTALHDESGRPIEGSLNFKKIPKFTRSLNVFFERCVSEKNIEENNPRNVVSNTIFTFLFKSSMIDTDEDKILKKLKMRDKKDMLLVYNDKEMIVYNDRKKFKRKSVFDPSRPDSREAFVAGLLLYRAVSAAWRWIPSPKKYTLSRKNKWTKRLFPDPYDKNNQEIEGNSTQNIWPFHEAVDFARMLAALWKRKTPAILDKRALLHFSLEKPIRTTWKFKQFDTWQNLLKKISVQGPREWIICINALAVDWIKKNQPSEFIDYLLEIATERKLGFNPEEWEKFGHKSSALELDSWYTIRTQFALQTLRWISIKTKKTIPSILSEYKSKEHPDNLAYLTDLDGTLIQSSGLRKMCLRRAFLTMLCKDIDSSKYPFEFPLMPDNSTLDRYHDPGADDRGKLSIPEFLERCVELYHAAVYKRWEDWEEIFRDYAFYAYGELPKDFRQVWNHPLSYPSFTWVINFLLDNKFGIKCSDNPVEVLVKAADEDTYIKILGILRSFELTERSLKRLRKAKKENKVEIQDGIIDRLKGIINGEFLTKEDFEAILKRTIGDDKINDYGEIILKYAKTGPREWLENEDNFPFEAKDFQNEIAPWEAKHKRLFEFASGSYWNVQYRPFRQTNELLRTLRDVFGIRLYIATEGHHDSQVKKLRTVHLDQFFTEAVTMSTGAAANPHEDLRVIQGEINSNKDRINSLELALKLALKLIKEKHHEDELETIFEEEKDKAGFHLNYLKVYKDQWEKFKKKDLGNIYSLMVASVMVEPECPVLELTSLRHLGMNIELGMNTEEGTQSKVLPMRFAMIGDRESKDIGPLLDRCGETTTVRFFTADHQEESLYWKPAKKPKEKPRALYVAWSPIQALLFLSYLQGWCKALNYDTMPPILPARLADEEGNIEKGIYQAMVWGNAKKREMNEGGEAFSWITFLTIQSTLRDRKINLVEFAKKIGEILKNNIIEEDKNIKKDDEEIKIIKKEYCRFTFMIIRELWRLVKRRTETQNNKEEICEILCDAICKKIKIIKKTKRELGITDEIPEFELLSVRMLNELMCNCKPPADMQKLIECLKDSPDMQRDLKLLFEEWSKCYAK